MGGLLQLPPAPRSPRWADSLRAALGKERACQRVTEVLRPYTLVVGAPDWIRTSDLQLRRLPLYPTELRARWGGRSYASAPGASISRRRVERLYSAAKSARPERMTREQAGYPFLQRFQPGDRPAGGGRGRSVRAGA